MVVLGYIYYGIPVLGVTVILVQRELAVAVCLCHAKNFFYLLSCCITLLLCFLCV